MNSLSFSPKPFPEMLQTGQHITQPADPLTRIPVAEVYRLITRTDSPLATTTARLRQVMQIDPQAYRRQKTTLPYITAGIFHPPVRRTEHFAGSHVFIFDFDHLHAEDQLPAAFEALKHHSLCHLLFRSPGGQGIKMIVRLSEVCTDRHLYTEQYKRLLFSIATACDLLDHADFRTHDVTRACFLSYDRDAWFMPDADVYSMTESLHGDKDTVRAEIETREKEARKISPETMPDDVLQRIKLRLNPDWKPREKKQYYVPGELETMMPAIRQALAEQEMMVLDEKPIQYGKQLRIGAGPYWAELNIFFGQRGFSVVKTTKTGSHAELASAAYQILSTILIP